MSGKSIIIVIGIVLFSFLVIVVLYALSDKPLQYAQGFDRKFENVDLSKKNVLDLKDNKHYFAGVTNSQIFLGSTIDSLELLITDTALSAPQRIHLSVSNDKEFSLLTIPQSSLLDKMRGRSLKLDGAVIEIDSPFFYVKAGKQPGIFKGIIGDWYAKRIADSIPFFSNAMHLAENSFAFSIIGNLNGSENPQNILGKISANNKVKLNPKALEGQVDNFFSTMGTMRYSKQFNQLVYTYAYRNEYFLLDTALNVKYKGNTIDTISHVHIKPTETVKGTHALASTPAIVNQSAQIHENLLFVHSNIMASNEDRKAFDQASVIDVYDLNEHKYRFSFYIPDYNFSKMTSFRITGNRDIIVLHDQYIVSYSLKNLKDFEL